MAMNNRGLGKGIDALFESASNPPQTQEIPLQYAPIDLISPSSDQPREVFDQEALENLAASIRLYGVLEPLLVRQGDTASTYRLIAGERRLKAARLAGLEEVPVRVLDLGDREALIITLLENLQREDLNPIEEARGIENLRDALNLTLEGLAETLGKSRSSLSHSLRMLKLPVVLQQEVAKGHIPPSHARTIAAISDEEALLRIGKRILEVGMTARETERAVAAWQEKRVFPWEGEGSRETTGTRYTRRDTDPGLGTLAATIGNVLKCRAKINGNQDKGKISLSYDSNSQLYELLDKLGLTLDNS